MKLSEYQKQAERTINNYSLEEFAMGLAGETGEVVDGLKKVLYHGHKLNHEEISKELGDVLWYVSAIATTLELDLDQISIKNIEKLRRRYPNGFEQERSVHRGDDNG